MPKAIEILDFLIDNKIINDYHVTHTIDLDTDITKIATDSEAITGNLAWIPHSPSNEYLNKFKGSILICLFPQYNGHIGYIRKAMVIQCENPKLAMAMVIKEFFIPHYPHTINFAESTITNSGIGKNVSIGPNCSIGAAGQGYANKSNDKSLDPSWVHFPHVGKVIIEDNVDIGANTVICRGTIGNTLIRQGTKIGSLVNIGHNVQIGKNVMIIAGAVICGSVEIGDNAWIGPSATILNKIKSGKGAKVGIGSVVTKDVPDNATVVGNPARKIR